MIQFGCALKKTAECDDNNNKEMGKEVGRQRQEN